MYPNHTFGIWITHQSARGYPYQVWEWSKMPRIHDDILDCVIYLYRTPLDAGQGKQTGGSGFLVSVHSAIHDDVRFNYAVTNSHVVREVEGNAPVVRLNTLEGDFDVLPLEHRQWIHHPDGDDVAVCPIGLSSHYHKYRTVPRDMFLTKEIVDKAEIGPGDDVYIVGRFISHEGTQRNLPSVRFGNIGMMPWEPIRHERGTKQESFVVELRSIGGYSGSPVFVEIPSFSRRPKQGQIIKAMGPWLLGVDWGHIYIEEPVRDHDNFGDPVKDKKWFVRANSGMAGAVPAWKLNELLDIKELIMQRDEVDRQIAEKRKQQSAGVELDTKKQIDEEVFTREDFERALRKVSKPKEDQSNNEPDGG
jgi:hypothetical protein